MRAKQFFITLSTLFTTFIWASENPPAGCPSIAMSGSAVSCFNGNNGTASIAISGGTGPFIINWSNGANSNSISGLAVGTYTVTVLDNTSGCTVLGAYVVNAPTPLVLTEIVSDVNCRNALTGAINASISGGTLPYTYDWSNDGTGDFDDLQDLSLSAAGNYSLEVHDGNSCSISRSYTILQPLTVLNSTLVKSDVSCFGGANGSINLSPFGGTFPYTYTWSNLQNTEDITGLSIGLYSVTITDNLGCTLGNSTTITQPAVLNGVVSNTQVNCFGQSTASINIAMVGGTAPYTYSWSNLTNLFSINNATLSNIPASNYTVNVTDSKGCTFVGNGVVTEPSLLVLSETHTNVTCFGYTNGAIDLSANGGAFPYTYAWVNAFAIPVGNTQDLTNLSSQNYSVIVTDFNGCTKPLSVFISQPASPISATTIPTHVNCYGFSTGAVDLTPAGGTAPYTYSWSNGQTSQDIANLISNNYAYTITDFNGCILAGSSIVTQPAAPLNVTNILTHVNCFGESNGAINLTTTGGTAPYTYTWINSVYNLSNTSEDLSNLAAETYTFTATDSKGCLFIAPLIITEPTPLVDNISGVNVLCKFGNNGSVDYNVSGGTLPYTYIWSNGQISEDISTLVAGLYTVTMLDAHNCTLSNSQLITEPLFPLTYSNITTNVKCNNGTDGSIDIEVNGGTIPYTYLWSNGATTHLTTDLVAGNYSFNVTDANGCIISDILNVTQPADLTLNEVITPVTCFGLVNGIIDVSPVGGTLPYNYTWFNSTFALSAQTQDLNNYPADIYQLEVIDSNGCFYEHFFTLLQPTELEVSFTSDNVNCAGGSDGSILIDIIGGNGTYTQLWSNGSVVEDLMNIPIGYYEVIVTDIKNCKDSIDVTIYEPAPLDLDFTLTDVSCIDNYDGTSIAIPSGGTGNVYYAWSTGATTGSIIDLPLGTYNLQITDILGCSYTESFNIGKDSIGCVFPVTAFSPNGDAYNDSWFIQNMDLYTNAEMTVFNKWGDIVYERKGLYEPWNGQIQGEDAPAAVYFYILYLNNEGQEKITGTISIVR
jgi:gliding motility-associated-like protein